MKHRRLIKTAIWILGTDALGFLLTWLFTGEVWGSLYATVTIGVLICGLYYAYEILWEHIDKKTCTKVRPYRELREELHGTAFIPQKVWEEATLRMMQKHSHALDMLNKRGD